MNGGSCLVVMYHYVRETGGTRFPGIRALAPALFEQQLDWLEATYTVIRPEALEAALDGGPALPPGAALVTFDDGFRDHYDTVFPRLCARGLSGVFFLGHASSARPSRLLPVHHTHLLLATLGPEAFGRAVLSECRVGAPVAGPGGVFGADHWENADDRAIKHLLHYELPFDEAERVLDALCRRHLGDPAVLARDLYLDPRMAGEMARGGMTFGYHTRTHRMLSRLSVDEQRGQLSAGVGWIQELTGQARVPFCYPWGGPRTYTAETVRLVRETGYSSAFNTVRRRLHVGADNRFALPRFDTRDLPPHTSGEAEAVAAAMEDEA